MLEAPGIVARLTEFHVAARRGLPDARTHVAFTDPELIIFAPSGIDVIGKLVAHHVVRTLTGRGAELAEAWQ